MQCISFILQNFALHLVKMEEAALVRTRVAALWDMSAYGVKKVSFLDDSFLIINQLYFSQNLPS